tara:strand:- start:103 stop:1248 length:1146 start_codon:yes stop_codon:yes gene_type:complete
MKTIINQIGNINKEQRKIIFVISTLELGGAQRVLEIVADHFKNKGDKVSIIILSGKILHFLKFDSEIDINWLNIAEEYNYKYKNKIIRNLMRIKIMRNTLLSLQPDIVFSFMGGTSLLTFLSILGKDIHHIASERNNIISQNKSRIWRYIIILMYKYVGIATANNKDIAFKMSILCKRKVIYLPNPIKCIDSKIIPSFDKRKNIILVIGRLEYQKDYPLLFKCLNIIKANLKGWKINIAGDGSQKNYLVNLVENLGLTSYINFLGNVDNINKLIDESSFLCSTSRYEGNSNAICEAALRCLPILATQDAVQGNDFIKNGFNSLIVQSRSVEIFADNLLLMIEDKNLRLRLAKGNNINYKESSLKILRIWEKLIYSERNSIK